MKKTIERNNYITNKKRVYDILKNKNMDLFFIHKDTMYHYIFLIEDTTFEYSEGLGHEPITEQNKKEKIINALHCVLLDGDTMNFFKSIDDFANEFGYTSISQAIRVFYLCQETHEKLKHLFTQEELQELKDNIQL